MKIYNVQIKTMEKRRSIENGWIEIENGKIIAVEEGSPDVVGTEDLDGQGKLLIPGFIDAHTHLGIIENGIDFEGDDCNEATDPFTPQLRTIDGINPMDRCFEEAYKRGITSAVVAPGSANPCGGEIIAVKTYGRRVDDMIIKPVGIKFALGENPKRVYNDRDETPVTRMATAALIREGLTKAKRYLADIDAYEIDKENNDMPEFDLKNHALIPLLRREISAHFHCHRADDMFTAVRIAKEFDLKLVIVHATEGHLIADILGTEKLSAISGPVICDRCKPEMKGLELKNTAELVKNGVKTSICTDHPVIPIQYLPASAAMAVKGGLDSDSALEAITINAAEIAGIDDTTGSIAVGKDADLQLYCGDPLDIMNDPELVMINGKVLNNTKGDC
ncbi:amidohydrolase [Porcipelethomonas ammoniilytica]|uniref:amidohydrolase n=1 Tax=Porcipelethomonas ammoniilytica TaxID=2981722 RepID=UPI0008210FF6|nr:amidohydrolase [Porcipelethomonas ammoniilytica]MCU6719919.1 amidohydrolase [Porcipelethomonas ammoniilytica]SCI96950.1 phosphonate metabolism protein PhnM [uncultured Ruminococcus sp.]